jgi:anti-sigma28 factor (negative regulator of flagellin synthesis)
MTVLAFRYDEPTMSEPRPSRIERIQDRVLSGTYEVDPYAVAEALLARLLGRMPGAEDQCS